MCVASNCRTFADVWSIGIMRRGHNERHWSVQALTPAVDDWRRRITSLASRFERLKGQSPAELPALVEAQRNVDAAEHHVHGAEEASQQVTTCSIPCQLSSTY